MAMDNDEKSKVEQIVFEDAVISAEDLKTLDDESKKLLNHKCQYSVGKNGINVKFLPSPHLYDDNHKYTSEDLEVRMTDVNKICSVAVGAMNCDKVEAAFCDQTKEYDDWAILDRYSFREVNPFIRACELAWAKHYPLKIEPTHIWLLILQGVALHVDLHSELLRKKWVKFDGKKELIVRKDDFVKGLRAKNDWTSVIESFSDQIEKNTVAGTVELLDTKFSNSNKIDSIATKITIMDICKNYFEYTFMTMCGFPEITLTGTKDDWIKLYSKTKELLSSKVEQKFAKRWGDALLPILARFIQAFDGKIDCLFWNSMIKRGARRGSGSWSWYSGWINVFFPIIKNKDNEFCVKYSGTCDYIQRGLTNAGSGNDVNYYPSGLASAPVLWEYYNLKFKLKFIAGFMGVKFDKNTKELTPLIGWVIGEETKENEQALQDFKKKFSSVK